MNEYKKCDYIYDGILFSHKKEGNSATCDNMDVSRGYYAKWKRIKRDHRLEENICKSYIW